MSQEPQPNLSKYFTQQLEEYVENNNYASAISILETYFPSNGNTAVQKAKLYMKLNNYDQATEELEPYKSEWIPAIFQLGKIHLLKKEMIKAWKCFIQCLNSECEDEALYECGKLIEILEYQVSEEMIEGGLRELDHFIYQNEQSTEHKLEEDASINKKIDEISSPLSGKMDISNHENLTRMIISENKYDTSKNNVAVSIPSDEGRTKSQHETASSNKGTPSKASFTCPRKALLSNPLHNSSFSMITGAHLKQSSFTKRLLLERVIACYKIAFWKHNHAQSAYQLGCLYRNGTIEKLTDGSFNSFDSNVSKDVKAYKWMSRAAALQLPEAIFTIGVMWESGKGTPRQSFSKAAENYEVAARAGNESAIFHIGLCYWKGIGVRNSTTKALKYLCKAKQHKAAITTRGLIYLEQKNYLEALQSFREAATLGSSKALYNIAKMYLLGTPLTPKDSHKAKLMIREAASMGNCNALCDMGCFALQEGKYIEAFRNFTEAKARGSRWAIINLAKMYETEQSGLKKDILKAKELYTEALHYKETNTIANECLHSLGSNS